MLTGNGGSARLMEVPKTGRKKEGVSVHWLQLELAGWVGQAWVESAARVFVSTESQHRA